MENSSSVKLAYQLYSSRNFQPWSEVFEQLAKLGLRHVEGFGGLYEQADAITAALNASGLSMRSGHIGMDMLSQDPQKALELAQQMGMQMAFGPYLAPDQRPQDAAGYQAIGEQLARAAETLNAGSVELGWHNHDFEFIALPDGSLPIEHLLEGSDLVTWEIDVAWVVRAGVDPLPWIERYRDRIRAVHVKDLAAAGENTDEDGWADVGSGIVDWIGLLPALAETKNQWLILEHDNPSDHVRFASQSLSWLQQQGVS